jgi:hypothetical protein
MRPAPSFPGALTLRQAEPYKHPPARWLSRAAPTEGWLPAAVDEDSMIFPSLITAALFSLPAQDGKPPMPASNPPAASTASAAPAQALDSNLVAREVRTIPLDEEKANKVYRVRTALNLPAILQFPEGFASEPACGDCLSPVDARGNPLTPEALKGSEALFMIQTFRADNYIAIKPLRPAREDGGDGPPADDFLTTVTVRLKSKLTITLQVEYSQRSQADARVVFTLPNRQAESDYVREQLTRIRAELEADFAARVSERTTHVLLATLLESPRCSGLTQRVRQENLVLDVLEICRLGTRVFIRFTVENRGRASATIGSVTLAKKAGGQLQPLEEARSLLAKGELEFRATTQGVVGFELLPGEPPADTYTLTLTERASGHQLVAEGLGF